MNYFIVERGDIFFTLVAYLEQNPVCSSGSILRFKKYLIEWSTFNTFANHNVLKLYLVGNNFKKFNISIRVDWVNIRLVLTSKLSVYLQINSWIYMYLPTSK